MKRIALLIFCILATSLSLHAEVILGAQRTDEYIPLLKNKTVALFSNHTGTARTQDGAITHTLDVLIDNNITVQCVFAPEHGFRGTAGPGEKVADDRDPKTGVEIRSLYGGRKNLDLSGIDVVITDIQDVGTRFYTYYITMISLMEACAAQGVAFMVLDRPNPNGMYIDGPILEDRFRSGVGRLPIPVVHGLTLGEMALMANGEGWLSGGIKVDELVVIPCLGYDHSTRYELPVRPSPNLPTMTSIYLYPSLCLFEATKLSVGRGTPKAFAMYGDVDLSSMSHDDILRGGLDLTYIIEAYHASGDDPAFLSPWFEKLMGTDKTRQQIYNGLSASEIKQTWQEGLAKYSVLRQKYLIYK